MDLVTIVISTGFSTNLGLRDVLESVRHGESSLEDRAAAQIPPLPAPSQAQPLGLGNQPGQRQRASHGGNCLQQSELLEMSPGNTGQRDKTVGSELLGKLKYWQYDFSLSLRASNFMSHLNVTTRHLDKY